MNNKNAFKDFSDYYCNGKNHHVYNLCRVWRDYINGLLSLNIKRKYNDIFDIQSPDIIMDILILVKESRIYKKSNNSPCCSLKLYEQFLEKKSTRKESMKGYVYCFAVPENKNVFKIGITKDVVKRCSSLNTSRIYPGEMVRVIEVYDYIAVERYIHKAFKEYNVKGEFYEVSLEIVDALFRYISETDAII